MIRDGKTAGWLQLPSEAVLPWATFNSVNFRHITPGTVAGRGGALLASEALPLADAGDDVQALMTVPRDLILSIERIYEHALVDQDFREVLDSIGEFSRTPRGAILTFLLVQASVSCPHLPERVGVHSPFTDYVKSLPLESLPTFWTPDEQQLLVGTTLGPAVASKLKNLQREYDLIYDSIVGTRWYRAVSRHFDFDDWLQVDAMYRSRALDFPEIGHCMVPCIDLANHAAGEPTVAIYEKDGEGNAVLLLRAGKTVKEGDEITITYGDEKGACEMLFSYGFLEHDRTTAETLFLGLAIHESDPYRLPKMKTADCAPGFKLIDAGDGDIDWKGEFIWFMCVNEEDGLRFELARTVDGHEEMHAFFQDHELTGGAPQLYGLLGHSELWDIYRLRAVTLLQQRVFDQLQILYSTQEAMEGLRHGDGTHIGSRQYEQAMRLRQLEFELMERAYEEFEKQKVDLADRDVVKRYLADVTGQLKAADEDFS